MASAFHSMNIAGFVYTQKEMLREHSHFPSGQIGQCLPPSHIESLQASGLPQNVTSGVIRAIAEGDTLRGGAASPPES